MRYGKIMALTVLGVFVAAAPFAAQAQAPKDKTTTEKAKATVSDSWITSKTKMALFADDRVKGTQVSVDTNDKEITKAVQSRLSKDGQLKKVDVRTDGGVVTLTGEVPSLTAAAKASEMARYVGGVKSVKNELTVRQATK